MCNLLSNPKLFAAATVLFALASLYNLSEQGSDAPANRLTVVPQIQETLQSGPAAQPVSASHARS